MVLSSSEQPKDVDTAKLARECLKNMTGEDFIHLFWSNDESVRDFEHRFRNASAEGFEGEMSKLAMRYRNEGRPEGEQTVDMGGKKVRFENFNGESSNLRELTE